jgi:hypothetical protein
MVAEAPAPLPLKRRRFTNIDPMEVEAAKVIFLPKLNIFMVFVYAICNVLLIFIYLLVQVFVFDNGSIWVLSKMV